MGRSLSYRYPSTNEQNIPRITALQSISFISQGLHPTDNKKETWEFYKLPSLLSSTDTPVFRNYFLTLLNNISKCQDRYYWEIKVGQSRIFFFNQRERCIAINFWLYLIFVDLSLGRNLALSHLFNKMSPFEVLYRICC